MTHQPKSMRLTADEFFDWAMSQPSGRFELSAGEVVAMAPERVSHTRAKYRVHRAFESQLDAMGLGCEVLGDGVSVQIDGDTIYEPDALVRCGPRAQDDAIKIDDPVILVEVISPSSRGVDTSAKLSAYFRLPTVRHYLIIDTEARIVIHHRRDEDGKISARLLYARSTDATLVLDPPGLTIAIADFFARV